MGRVTAASINDRSERSREQKPGPGAPTENIKYFLHYSDQARDKRRLSFYFLLVSTSKEYSPCGESNKGFLSSAHWRVNDCTWREHSTLFGDHTLFEDQDSQKDFKNDKIFPILFMKYMVGFPTCKIFSDNRLPPTLLHLPLLPHHGRHALVEADPLVRVLRLSSICIAAPVLVTGVTVEAQILAALNQFLQGKRSGKDQKGESEKSVERKTVYNKERLSEPSSSFVQ